ncbi:MAG: molybdopterin-dependent oxidoreductase [Deltaproteobacteria bacterium]|nr:molybdopterin-dependent oxidoreductase [Deltaproteobacteria bacterium]
MALTRRDVIRNGLVVVGGTAAAPLFRGTLQDGAARAAGVTTWHKAPCRFCGTGCGVEVGVRDSRVVAVRGDEQSPVNEGLLCAKGFGLAKILYGADRLVRPRIRNSAGQLVDATWDEALGLIASKWTALVAEHGRDSVAMFGSGQWTIPEGYAALKFMKGGIRTNNLEVNARFCMASAVVGYLTTYGIDEPSGCYDDLDLADDFFLWGSNMAEMHPMLFNRILRRRQADAGVRVHNLTTFGHMTNQGADETLVFKPHSDLYLANAMAHVLVNEGLVDTAFIGNHAVFMRNISGTDTAIDLAAYTAFLDAYRPGDVATAVGISAADITRMARLYGDPARKTVSLWTMGMNQHTRGVWINNLVHNLHLLTGKVARPGNGPLSLTGQPSACGTCREVGTFTHRLPSDRVVANAAHRAAVESVWGVPAGTIPSPAESPLTDAMAMFEKLANGSIKSVWINTTNPFQSMPNLDAYLPRIRAADPFIVVSDIYPSRTVDEADVILPSACWVEKEGLFGNTERRTQHFAKLVPAAGDARPDVWQFVEVARRMGFGHLFPAAWDGQLERSLFDEYRQLTLGTHHDLATFDELVASRGLRWPVHDGVETKWRFNAAYDPAVAPGAPDGIEFYGRADKRAVVWARPYEAPPEIPDANYPFWLCTGRVLEHWHTGTMTRRVPELHRAVPEAVCYINDADAARLGVGGGDRITIRSRRGSVQMRAELPCRVSVPPGLVYVPFFDEDYLINKVVLGAVDPQSKQPDYKKCAVSIEKA